jgi:pantoate--beta-alanine ligase
MGALHRGHLELVRQARQVCDQVVVSIFVNPAQFNKESDLSHYPRREALDIESILTTSCHLVYLPETKEVYPENYTQPHYPLEVLEEKMEGLHRPGHFQGVAAVLDRFFVDIAPDIAFFGEKDYQQLAVVRRLVEFREFPIEIVGCETVREKNGLALSSRNLRLSNAARSKAHFIYDGLSEIRESLNGTYDAHALSSLKERWDLKDGVQTEYLEVARASDFHFPSQGGDLSSEDWRLFTAVQVEGVRLIDNISLSR